MLYAVRTERERIQRVILEVLDLELVLPDWLPPVLIWVRILSRLRRVVAATCFFNIFSISGCSISSLLSNKVDVKYFQKIKRSI